MSEARHLKIFYFVIDKSSDLLLLLLLLLLLFLKVNMILAVV